LIETLHAFDRWLETAATTPATKSSYWKRWFGRAPEKPPLDKGDVLRIREDVKAAIKDLEALLHSEDGADITHKKIANEKGAASAKAGSKLGVPQAVEIEASLESTHAAEKSLEVTEQAKRDKIQFLLRHIIDYQKLFEKIVAISAGDAFIFLDDLYHIRKTDQAQVLDYFHRIVKGRSVWLKIGTIKHRTEWYHHGAQPVGLKLGDDCDEIDLDVTLEKYETAKKFLLQILQQLIEEANLGGCSDLLTDGGIERLVLASGGVARDFLTIFRKSIDVARERGETYRGDKINAEDVNAAAGEHDSSKRDELKRDTLEERAQLEQALQTIQEFCIERKVNCFLVEQIVDTAGQEILGELVDLRFVHVVASRISVRDTPGKLYTTYMLDISQYTGERRRREFEMVAFWKREDLDKLRRSLYVLEAKSLVRAINRSQVTRGTGESGR
jgi:hypothetical protein